jgi:DNA helicase-2/ATP-dependent DNA helicase PcrA
LQKNRNKEAEFGECAVLYRTNAQSRILEERLVRESVPYVLVGGVNFYARKEIKDILAYLKTIDNGRDDLAVRRIINIPKRGIGTTTLNKIQEYANQENISFYEALCRAEEISSLGRSGVKLVPFVDMIQVLRTRAKVCGLKKLLEDVLEATGYVEYLKETEEEDAEDRIDNINELVSKAAAYEEEHPEGTLSEFLEEVALVADIDTLEEGSNRVMLMTIHSAKGLEFPHVYLAGMEDGVFPSYMTIIDEDPTAIEEERRLAYVGITRAMKDLTLSAARTRMVRGETQYNPVSRFIREIPEELMDNRPQPVRRQERVYEEDSPQRLHFQSKPFGEYGQTKEASFVTQGMGVTRPANAVYTKPKAVVRPKATALENKPFIAKGTAGLSKGAPAGQEPDYGVGDRVKHIKYGEGTVKALEKEPRDYKVTVEFDGAGQKIMYAAFAKLKKV